MKESFGEPVGFFSLVISCLGVSKSSGVTVEGGLGQFISLMWARTRDVIIIICNNCCPVIDKELRDRHHEQKALMMKVTANYICIILITGEVYYKTIKESMSP